jgi:hypothetical protein
MDKELFDIKDLNSSSYFNEKINKNPKNNCSKLNELVEFEIIIHIVQAFPFCCQYAKGHYLLCLFTKFPLEV